MLSQVIQLTLQLSGACIWIDDLNKRQKRGINHLLWTHGVQMQEAHPTHLLAPGALLHQANRR